MDVYFQFKVFWTSCGFEFCCKTSVLTISYQDRNKRKKHRGKVLLWPFFHGLMTTICKMASWMFLLDEDFLLLIMQFFLQKASVLQNGTSSFIILFIFHLVEDLLHYKH